MKTIFLTVYDGDVEKVILRSGVLQKLKESNNRIVLLVRGSDRLEYYKKVFESDTVIIELLPKAMTRSELLWYHLGWNTIPTHSVALRRYTNFKKHRNVARYALEVLAGLLGYMRMWRNFLRLLYRYIPDTYCDLYFEKYKPDLVFTPNMFSAEDMRVLKAAKKRGIRTIATAKSWDVLTTKAFTRVKADRIIVFNEFNRNEAITLGDYNPSRVIVTGFPQFDGYAKKHESFDRQSFCSEMGINPANRILLFAVPGTWLAPYSYEILQELDELIDTGTFSVPVTILARLHPKYTDETEKLTFRNIIVDRPGTLLANEKEFSIDMAVSNVYQWTFTSRDIQHLADSILASDVVINTASTISLDAAALHKPSILIAYDGSHTVPDWNSVARVYERDHYAHVVELGATPIAHSTKELITEIEYFLTNPQYLAKERAMLMDKVLFKSDGLAATRIAQAVLTLLS